MHAGSLANDTGVFKSGELCRQRAGHELVQHAASADILQLFMLSLMPGWVLRSMAYRNSQHRLPNLPVLVWFPQRHQALAGQLVRLHNSCS